MAKNNNENTASKSREELELERAVFGDSIGFEAELENLDLKESLSASESESDSFEEEANDEAGEDDELFFIDKGSDASADEGDMSDESDSEEDSDEDEEVAIWHDSDDGDLEYDLTSTNRAKKLRRTQNESYVSGKDYEKRLRSHFEKLYSKPNWALPPKNRTHGNDDLESDEEFDAGASEIGLSTNPLKDLLSQSTSYLSSGKSKLLPPSDLDIQRLADVTKQMTSKAVVQSVDFHPTQPLVLSGGFDKTLRIYQIDGKNNPVASSLYIENCPFRTALFHPDGKRVIAGGRRRYLFIWDLETGSVEKVSRLYGNYHTQNSFEKFVLSPCGKYIALIGDQGWMNLLSAESGQWLAGAKVEGKLVDLTWVEPTVVTLVNSRGEVWNWDSESRHFVSRWRDPSLVGVTALAQGNNWIALGMENGIVSVYDKRNPKKTGFKVSDSEPEVWEATGVVENLVTSISSMKFSPDEQMLVISSKLKRDSLRIVHLPSLTVFKNWPTSSTPLGHVSCVAWSPQTQMLIAGNEGGHIRLWSLNHYW